MNKKIVLDKDEWERNVQKVHKEHRELRERQMKDGTLCVCGATTPKEHLGICDYCWEASQMYKNKM